MRDIVMARPRSEIFGGGEHDGGGGTVRCADGGVGGVRGSVDTEISRGKPNRGGVTRVVSGRVSGRELEGVA